MIKITSFHKINKFKLQKQNKKHSKKSYNKENLRGQLLDSIKNPPKGRNYLNKVFFNS